MDARALQKQIMMVARDYFQLYTSGSSWLSDGNEELIVALSNISLDVNVDNTTAVLNTLLDLEPQITLLAQRGNVKGEEGYPAEAITYCQTIRDRLSNALKEVFVNYAKENKLFADGNGLTGNEDLQKTINTIFTTTLDKHPEIFENPANFNSKKLQDFAAIGQLGKNDGSGAFSHSTTKMHKVVEAGKTQSQKHDATWYAKLCEDRTVAAREVVAQEFVRLLMPYQPKTRLARADNSKLFVLSQEIAGTKPLEMPVGVTNEVFAEKTLETRAKLASGEYKGAGKVMIADLWLCEGDGKLGNNLVDKQGRIIKIDGDWAFASLLDGKKDDYRITATDIGNLPFVQDFKAHNFFDWKVGGNDSTNYTTANFGIFDLTKTPDQLSFRQEINEGMLQVLMMPKDFVEFFVKSYIQDPVEIKLLTDFLYERTLELRQAAVYNPSFQAYMQTPAAARHVEDTIVAMQEFNTMGKNNLLDNNVAAPIAFRAEFMQLKQDTLAAVAGLLAPKTMPNFPPPLQVRKQPPPIPPGAVKGMQPPPLPPGAVKGMQPPPLPPGAVKGMQPPPLPPGAVKGMQPPPLPADYVANQKAQAAAQAAKIAPANAAPEKAKGGIFRFFQQAPKQKAVAPLLAPDIKDPKPVKGGR